MQTLLCTTRRSQHVGLLRLKRKESDAKERADNHHSGHNPCEQDPDSAFSCRHLPALEEAPAVLLRGALDLCMMEKPISHKLVHTFVCCL